METIMRAFGLRVSVVNVGFSTAERWTPGQRSRLTHPTPVAGHSVDDALGLSVSLTMILGLSVAALWGAGDFLAAIASRRLGSLTTLMIAQATEVALCVAAWSWLRPTTSVANASVLVLLFVGVVTAISYGALYRGLMLGPVAIVAPIASAYATGPAILAVALLHERISVEGGVGAAATILGVVIITSRMSRRAAASQAARGIPFAVVASAGFAVSAFLLATFAGELGWLLPVFLSRIGVAVVLAVVIVGVRPAEWIERPLGVNRITACAAVAGASNVAGTAAYAHAGELGRVAVVSVVSALFPLVPILGGLTMFHERLTVIQVGGICMTLVGLLLLNAA